MNEKALFREATNKFGIQAQYIKTMEECAELIKAVAKKDILNMAEEIADVRIMCDQLELFWKLDTKSIRKQKLERLAKLLKSETCQFKDDCLVDDCLDCECNKCTGFKCNFDDNFCPKAGEVIELD